MRLILIYLLKPLCVVLIPLCVVHPAPAPTHTALAAKETPLSFTIETKQKAVEFLKPIAIRVVLRNNSQSPLSLDPTTLRLHPENWHVVGSWGAWSGRGEGYPLDVEDKPAGRVDLKPGASLRLLTVHKFPTFELLGPTRIAYTMTSTDAVTSKLLPEDAREVSLNIPPTKLMTSVWTASSQAEPYQSQPLFNDFLKLWSKTETATTEDEETDFQKRLADEEFATKTLFYLAGYALPFLSDAMRDKDAFIRAQAVLAYPYAAGAIEQLDAYLEALDALGPRPQWASTLEKAHNKDQSDWRVFAVRALTDPAPGVRTAAVEVLTKKYWAESKRRIITTDIGVPNKNPEQVLDKDSETADKRD